MVRLQIHKATTFALVRPHYAENVGAAARAIKTMGFSRLVLIEPSRAALPHSEGAVRMAAKSWDVLDAAETYSNVDEAIAGFDHVFSTSSHAPIERTFGPREAAEQIVRAATNNERTCILFGNEKTGLSDTDRAGADSHIRIEMAAPQPSINLAQAVQIVAYELFTAARTAG